MLPMPVLQSQLQIMISRKSQGCMQSLPGEAPRFKLGHNMNPAGSFRWILLLMDSAKNKQRFFPHFTFEIPSKPMSWIFKRLFISFCSVSRQKFQTLCSWGFCFPQRYCPTVPSQQPPGCCHFMFCNHCSRPLNHELWPGKFVSTH